jgi:hypothetical protein
VTISLFNYIRGEGGEGGEREREERERVGEEREGDERKRFKSSLKACQHRILKLCPSSVVDLAHKNSLKYATESRSLCGAGPGGGQ